MAANHGGAIDEAHRRIIAVIQPVLKRYGFGLAGGNALRAHGLSHRPTRDINVFTPTEGAVSRAVPEVERALRDAGFEARATGGSMTGLVHDWDEWTARWNVTAGERRARRQPEHGRKTRPAERASPGNQGGEDRSLRPEAAMSHSLPR
jgi:hypothetical protein